MYLCIAGCVVTSRPWPAEPAYLRTEERYLKFAAWLIYRWCPPRLAQQPISVRLELPPVPGMLDNWSLKEN